MALWTYEMRKGATGYTGNGIVDMAKPDDLSIRCTKSRPIFSGLRVCFKNPDFVMPKTLVKPRG
jgi:hypothetical protein